MRMEYIYVLKAEVAELADALGSGPSPVHTGWRFESSLRHLGGLSTPFVFSCTGLQVLAKP